MKSVSGAKSNKFDSPKTPGGISRSLLTPCRRLGLSRNWKKPVSSPFQSPVSSSEVTPEDTKKRKESDEKHTPEKDLETEAQTPTRIELPRRKKSKILLAAINKSVEHTETKPEEIVNSQGNDPSIDNIKEKLSKESKTIVSPLRLKTKSRSIKKVSPNSTSIVNTKENICTANVIVENKHKDNITNETDLKNTKRKSPNNLTKECIVVLQKKIFKKELKDKRNKVNETTQMTDSDSDDIPLVHLNKECPKLVENNDDDFITKPNISSKPKTPKKSPKINKTKKLAKTQVHEPPISQNSDDDDFVDTKKTILIRKSYNKIIKPQKAKSTGSITQKDIEDLKARIETKKKMLLAKSMMEDTKELKDLIKKWQKGCQDALMELMDLMKNKFPDKQNMDYSEILETLKIPPGLVGYDSDNDCFLTPNDEDVILARFKE